MSTCLDIDALLQPLAEDAPCGNDMEYDADFTALMAAAIGKPEQQLGDLVVPAVAPDWPAAIALAQQLLARGRDLRVACRLAQALLHVEGLPGLRDGLALVHGCVARWWEDMHPRLDAEDGFDPAIRVNALALLCHPAALVLPLREVALLRSASGRAVCLNAITQAQGAGQEADAVDDALADAARRAHAEALAIEAALLRHVGAARALDMEPLVRPLADIAEVATQWLQRRGAAGLQPAESEGPADLASQPVPPGAEISSLPEAGAAAPAVALATGVPGDGLRDRTDVLRCLDALCGWFREREPSHPAPLLLERARRWVEMDFMALLRDVAPQAVQDAERLRGVRAAE